MKEQEDDTKSDLARPKSRSKFEPLPTSISGFSAPVASIRRGDNKNSKARAKTAQELVRDSAPIRPPASLLDFGDAESKPALTPALTLPPSAGFVKPAGVDAPAVPAASARKRDRGQGPDAGTEGKKRRRKKEASS